MYMNLKSVCPYYHIGTEYANCLQSLARWLDVLLDGTAYIHAYYPEKTSDSDIECDCAPFLLAHYSTCF